MLIPLLFSAELVATVPDCGTAAHKALIQKTESMIISRAYPRVIIEGWEDVSKACVRLEFTISKDGIAQNVHAVNTYESMAVGRVGLEAVPMFKFKAPEPGHEKDIYTLVIWGTEITNRR